MHINAFCILLCVFQIVGILILMLVSALMAALISPKIKFHGPLFTAWVVTEVLSSTILVIIFIELILAFAYDLRVRQSLYFQEVKLGLWVLVVLVGITGLVATRPSLHPKFVGGWTAGLGVVL